MTRCALILLAVATQLAWAEAKPVEPKPWAPVEPELILRQTTDADLVADRGEGDPRFIQGPQGKSVTSRRYKETWFGLPLTAEYLLLDAAPRMVHQITLEFEDAKMRDKVIEEVSTYLGEADQFPSDPGVPSQYQAHWIHNGVRYDLQDYSDYMEMYIAPALFENPDAYRLPDSTVIVQQNDANVTGDAAKERVRLLAVPGKDPGKFMERVYLLVGGDAEKKGLLVPLPEDAGGFEPRAAYHDFTGDGLAEAFVAVPSGGSSGNEAQHVYTFAGGKAKDLLPEEEQVCVPVEGAFADGYKATVRTVPTNETATLDLSDRKGYYDHEGLYKDGKLVNEVGLTADRLVWLEPADLDGDGTWEFKGRQTLSGLSAVDVVVRVDTLFGWRDGAWKLIDVQVGPPPP